MNKTDFLLSLKFQKGVGYVTMLKIACQLDIDEVNEEKLKQLDLPDSLYQISLKAIHDQQAKRMIERIRKQCRVISFFDDIYPQKLREIYQPPLILFGRGDFSLLKNKAVAIVGARAASDYSRYVINHLMPDIVKHNLTIVSGLAQGVDGLAHQAALANQGKTIAVVGNGLNHYFPKQNYNLQNKIIEHGLLLSEYLPDTPPRPFRFPQRNIL